jgi:hypothetical protein
MMVKSFAFTGFYNVQPPTSGVLILSTRAHSCRTARGESARDKELTTSRLRGIMTSDLTGGWPTRMRGRRALR